MITVICIECYEPRQLQRRPKVNICRKCANKKRSKAKQAERHTVTCPECNSEREVSYATHQRIVQGGSKLCRTCAWEKRRGGPAPKKPIKRKTTPKPKAKKRQDNLRYGQGQARIDAKAKAIKALESKRVRVDLNAPMFQATSMTRQYTEDEAEMIAKFIKKKGVTKVQPSIAARVDDEGRSVNIRGGMYV